MARVVTFIAFLVLAVLAAGAFGAIHDQVSYTVSYEYFTRFKFPQFGLLDPAVPERVRVAFVGFLASWWMGIPIGLLTGIGGLFQLTTRHMQIALLRSLVVITGFTLLFALGGLLYGYLQTAHLDLINYSGWYIPGNLAHPRHFICAGYMHNSAYIGGALAIPVAWLYHFYYRRRSLAAA